MMQRGFVKLFSICVHLGAYVGFGINVVWTIGDLMNEKTGESQYSELVENLPLPTVTVCMQDMFKGVDENTTTEEFLGNLDKYKYSATDFFDKSFMERFAEWNAKYVFGLTGICISLTLDKNVTEVTQNMYWIKLLTNKKYRVGL